MMEYWKHSGSGDKCGVKETVNKERDQLFGGLKEVGKVYLFIYYFLKRNNQYKWARRAGDGREFMSDKAVWQEMVTGEDKHVYGWGKKM